MWLMSSEQKATVEVVSVWEDHDDNALVLDNTISASGLHLAFKNLLQIKEARSCRTRGNDLMRLSTTQFDQITLKNQKGMEQRLSGLPRVTN